MLGKLDIFHVCWRISASCHLWTVAWVYLEDEQMSDAGFWSDFLLALIAVVLAVLLATGYPGERKVKPKVKRDYKAEWREL